MDLRVLCRERRLKKAYNARRRVARVGRNRPARFLFQWSCPRERKERKEGSKHDNHETFLRKTAGGGIRNQAACRCAQLRVNEEGREPVLKSGERGQGHSLVFLRPLQRSEGGPRRRFSRVIVGPDLIQILTVCQAAQNPTREEEGTGN